jgi:SulP family sulfate permease
MIAILEAARAGLFRREHWTRNVVAGVIVGIVALPLAMAFAIASGAKPQQGIYTSIIAALIVALFGGTRIQIAGPTGAFVVVLAAITAEHGIDGLLLATLMAGLMLMAFGIGKFGVVLRFIPNPVIRGFTAGIAVLIWVGQWSNFLGLPAVEGRYFHEKLWHLVQALPSANPGTAVLALVTLLAVVVGPRLPGLRPVPGPVFGLIVATALRPILHLDDVATISTAFGGIPAELPHFAAPAITTDRLITLLPAAFTIALLGAIESLLSAVVADGMASTRHDPNQELLGQGIANVIAPLFGGFAATGAIARTATNFRNGATGPLAAVVHSLTLLLIVLALAPVVGQVPLCALSAILFVVAWNMSEAPQFVRMARRAPWPDVTILLVTFLLTIFTDLVVAVNAGVLLATLLFLRRMSQVVAVNQVVADRKDDSGLRDRDTIVYAVDGPLFFAAMENFERTLAAAHLDPRNVIIRLGNVPFMDISGIEGLESAVHALERRGVHVVMCEARGNVLAKLRRAGLLDDTAHARYRETLAAALASLDPLTRAAP